MEDITMIQVHVEKHFVGLESESKSVLMVLRCTIYNANLASCSSDKKDECCHILKHTDVSVNQEHLNRSALAA